MNYQQMVKPAVIAAAVLGALVVAGLPVGYLGFLLVLLVCPLMMFVMMRSMGNGGSSESHDRDLNATQGNSEER